MRKSVAIIIALALGCATASAQGVNQTVRVENNYVSELAGVQKLGVEMSVPDSLLHFDYNFDYSVFETPFKGAYEFTPYSIHVQPDASEFDGSSFWFKAGAGYTLHPVLQFVAAPVVKSDRMLSIYNNGSGYIGRSIGNALSTYGTADSFNGWDFSDRLGIEGRWLLSKVSLKGDVHYDVIGAGDNLVENNSTTHALNAGISVDPVITGKFAWNATVKAGVLESFGPNMDPFGGYNASVASTMGQAQGDVRILADVLVAVDRLAVKDDGDMKVNFHPLFSVTPHTECEFAWGSLRAGLKLEYGRKFTVAPDLRVSTDVLGGSMKLFAGLDGGQSLTDYLTLRSNFHRALPMYCVNDISYERYHVYAGLDGHYGNGLQYGFKAGYRNFQNTAMECLYGWRFGAMNVVYADANVTYKNERIDADMNLHLAGSSCPDEMEYFALPTFSADAGFTYNWNKRIYAGLWCEGRTVRKGTVNGTVADLPAYVNLGLDAEARVSNKLGFWLEAGNLLCQEIWRNPVCAEKGPYFTVGICLKF